VEVLIGLAIGAMLLTAMGTAVSVMSKSVTINQDLAVGVGSASRAMDAMVASIRQCQSCDIVTTGTKVSGGSPVQGTELTFTDNTGASNSYRYDSTQKQVLYVTPSPPSPLPSLVSSVDSCTFWAWYATNAKTSALYACLIKMELKVTNGKQTVVLTRSVVPRQTETVR
jgi:hypothetical protein